MKETPRRGAATRGPAAIDGDCGASDLVGGNGAQERDSAAKLLRRRKVDPFTMATLPFNMEIPFDAREAKPAGNYFAG